MKKVLLFLFFLIMLPASARDVIYKTTDGTVMKCTYKMEVGSIKEYNKNKVFRYTFRNGKIYSRDYFDLIAPGWKKKYKKGEPHAMFVRIKPDKLIFSEYASSDTGVTSHRVRIDRKTGKCTFKALRTYHWSGRTMYRKKAKGTGMCTIIK